ncbi:hypothetical protein [Methyloterricola oryzae]|uniref:hypothetical protein n=1 Tax=Methyloterricola oryzae TaxID=1495050 RepID=UPI0011AF74FD|nr:hypothetical protein [Methyloterricola oryzae]
MSNGLSVVFWIIDFESKHEDATSVAELVHHAISDGIDAMEKDLLSSQNCSKASRCLCTQLRLGE